jgi:hypothetical protein
MRPFDHAWLPGRCVNIFLTAALLSALMEFSTEACSTALALIGVKGVRAFKNPLFLSTSPKDFWGRRWNLVIHKTLKRLCFKPLVLMGCPVWAATLAAFAISGAFHEYMWSIMCFSRGFVLGEVTVFFAYQAGLCVVQALLERVVPASLGKCLPRVVKWFATVAAITPSGHLFVDNIAEMLSASIGRAMPVLKEPFWGLS